MLANVFLANNDIYDDPVSSLSCLPYSTQSLLTLQQHIVLLPPTDTTILFFHIDIVRNSTDIRYIIRDVFPLEEIFKSNSFKFSIYASIDNILKTKDKIFVKKVENNSNIDLFVNIDNKLVNFDFNQYSIRSYKALDEFKKSNLLDYSLEIT